MSKPARDRANAEQLLASDPTISAFVAASAGSGKTKLLTDRLLRLMLAGAPPERIQCLTFTKAAAAEMALRLQRTLGEWVTLEQPELDRALRALEVEPNGEIRAAARALFARVLDLPGGMRIGTFHAFCQSLLRRFPLEAQISPHFQVLEDLDVSAAMHDAREAMLAADHLPERRAALERLAGLVKAEDFGELVGRLGSERHRLQQALRLGSDLAGAQRRVLGVSASDESALMAEAVSWTEDAALLAAARQVAEEGSNACAARATRILDWLALDPSLRAQEWEAWRKEFLTQGGEARGQFVNPRLSALCPELAPLFAAEAERILRYEDSRRALEMAEVSAALLTLAKPVLEGFATTKEQTGLLDYDDLIGRTSALLVDPGAAWVLYKLDGGLDHLLLDEVQDTSPAQWRIAHALTTEFFAGQGAREGNRTVFAVGDRKQSIYSFQGADIEAFDRSRQQLESRVREAGGIWRGAQLDVSFRSTAPVLALVDEVFRHPAAAAGVVEIGQGLTHFADRAGHAGSVELWPLAPAPEMREPEAWTIPDSNESQRSAPQRLADKLADWVRAQTSGDVELQSRGRPLLPGDVLILLRRRTNDFTRALVRALKARGVRVAGLDRMVLTEQPAVQDLMALGDALLLPQDDLAVACVLTSPLGGLSDESLMQLAVGRDGVGRDGTLWGALRSRAAERADWGAAWDFLHALQQRVDFTTPHALLARALGPLGGRARLYARLGPEAAEPVDELLTAALAYARTHPPSLQGFLHWLRQAGAEVKREAEGAGDAVRIMTVHGAKGLQAPLVILPDTTAVPQDNGLVLWAADPETGVEVPLWSPRKEIRCGAAGRLRESAARRQADEHNRLLYVALTRAEDQLLVCGWQPHRAVPATSWYALVKQGFASLSAIGLTSAEPLGEWGDLLRHASPQLAAPDRVAARDMARHQSLPSWAGSAPDWRPAPLPPEPARPEPLAPSRPEGASLGPVPQAASPFAARGRKADRVRRGQIVHTLLQYLPAIAAPERDPAARAWLDRPGHDLTAAEADAIRRETLAILDHPELAALFGPDSRAEVPLSGFVDGVVIGGMVDRLAVLQDRVLVGDYKTGRDPPPTAEQTPVLYLRQMAAYRAVLRGVFPGRPVRCVLVWTQAGRVSALPDVLLDAHAPASQGASQHRSSDGRRPLGS